MADADTRHRIFGFRARRKKTITAKAKKTMQIGQVMVLGKSGAPRYFGKIENRDAETERRFIEASMC